MTKLDWETRATLQVAMARQRTGDCEGASELYEHVLGRVPDHPPTVHNLAVCEIRRGVPEQALHRIDDLLLRDRTLVGRPRRWPPVAFPLAYNRALALSQIDDENSSPEAHKQAEELSTRIMVALTQPWAGSASLRTRRSVVTGMELASLVLYAGLHVTSEAAPKAADGLLAARPVSRRRVRDAIGGDPVEAGVIAAYASVNAGGDPRVHYNLACFASRLSDRVEEEDPVSDRLRTLALDHFGRARHDPALRAWARDDPSLKPMHTMETFRELTTPATPAAAPAVTPVPAGAAPSAGEPRSAGSASPVSGATALPPEPDPWRDTLRRAGIRFGRAADLVSVKIEAAEKDEPLAAELVPSTEFAGFLDRFEAVPDRALEVAVPEATLYRTRKGPLLFVPHDSGPELIGPAARLAADRDHVGAFVRYTVRELASAKPLPPALVLVSRRIEEGERVLGRIEPATQQSAVDDQVDEAVARLTGRQ